MLDALDRERWQPVVAAPEGPLLDEVRARKVPAHPLPFVPLRRPHGIADTLQMLPWLFRGRRELLRVAREVQPGLVHANTTSAMWYALALRAYPVIWQVRDLTPLGPLGGWMYRQATMIAAISEAVRDSLLRYTRRGDTKIILLPPAVDTARFSPPAEHAAGRARLGLPATDPLIGMVAQFVPWKNHHLFLDALELLSEQPWHAVLTGADLGRQTAYLAELQERLASPPLRDRVTWLPWQSDPSQLFGTLDLCVLTSEREPFGRVLIEAMASETPVVAIDSGGPREVVVQGKTGLLVPPTPMSLAAAITSLLDDPALRARYGREGRRRVETHFSLNSQRAALDALYASVLEETDQ